MGTTLVALGKKLVVALLSNKDSLKKIGVVILSLAVAILAPLFAVIAVFSSTPSIDTEALTNAYVSGLSQEQIDQLALIEANMTGIENAMIAAGFDRERIQEAQVVYALVLYQYMSTPDQVNTLVGCFGADQSDAQTVANINAAFGAGIDAGEYSSLMNSLRSSAISLSGYVNPSTKNNLDLVTWAKHARDRGWGYVWGTYGYVLTGSYLEGKAQQYPEEVGGQEEFIRTHWLGRRVVDCIGFIKGYGWLDPDSLEIRYGTNGMPDVTADGMYDLATEKGPISTIPEIPGLAVFHTGHIGIYIGDGKVIEAMGTHYGVVETDLSYSGWTHWLKIPYIQYIGIQEETPEPSETTVAGGSTTILGG